MSRAIVTLQKLSHSLWRSRELRLFSGYRSSLPGKNEMRVQRMKRGECVMTNVNVNLGVRQGRYPPGLKSGLAVAGWVPDPVL